MPGDLHIDYCAGMGSSVISWFCTYCCSIHCLNQSPCMYVCTLDIPTLSKKQCKFPRYNFKCMGKRDTTVNEIYRVVSSFLLYISCYKQENRLPLEQWSNRNFCLAIANRNRAQLVILCTLLENISDDAIAQLYVTKFLIISLYLTKLYFTQNFAIASSVTYSDICKNLLNSVVNMSQY